MPGKDGPSRPTPHFATSRLCRHNRRTDCPALQICPRFLSVLCSPPATRKRVNKRAKKRERYGTSMCESPSASICARLPVDSGSLPTHTLLFSSKSGHSAGDRSGRTGTDSGTAGRYCLEPGELGRQRNRACRRGPSRGYGSGFVLPGTRGHALVGNGGWTSGYFRPHTPH